MSATRDEYTDFCEGVRRLCAIDLAQYKRGQLERRIRTHAGTRGQTDLPTYLGVLKRDATELESFLDRVTINVSQLWRHPEQWDVLEQRVERRLLLRRRGVHARRRRAEHRAAGQDDDHGRRHRRAHDREGPHRDL